MKHFLWVFALILWISTVLLAWCDSPAKVHPGDTVSISYTSSFADGEVFQNSWAIFTVGSGRFLEGIEKGVLGMKVWQTKKITVPAKLWYGANYNPFQLQKISKLVFDKMTQGSSWEKQTFFTIAGVRWVIKGIEKDENGNEIVLRDINPRETRDTLVYKVTIVSKK